MKKKGHYDVVVDEVKKMVKEGLTGSFWASISAIPKNTRFEAQNEGETVLLLLRSHPIVNLSWIALIVFLLPVPFFWGSFPLIESVTPILSLFISILWYLGLSLLAMMKFLTWFYSVFIVTDERVIDVDFYGFLFKNIDVTQIKNIEEVNYRQAGILAHYLNFGNVIVQTASEQRTAVKGEKGAAFTFESVPDPDRVARVISELMQQEEQEEIEGRVR